jgi:5'-nucleotidase
MPYRAPRMVLCSVVIAVTLGAGCAGSMPHDLAVPRRVLLTNDNGIDDVGLVELARAFARDSTFEVVVVAATRDRSGTSNFLGATQTGRYSVERRDLGAGIEAWALDGYPADCVIFALTGPLHDRVPDIVVSGINGGANLADDWFGSGTIGAARTAAYFGIPAVAVSGLEDDDSAAVAAATSWVVRFVRSPVVASLEPPEYLTVSLPVGSPRDIRGVRFVERARGLMEGRSRRIEGDDSVAVWQLELTTNPQRAGPGTDVRAVAAGEIAIVPMRVDEYDLALAERLRRRVELIPEWIPTDSSVGGFACGPLLGVTIDDAEDAEGREWGVLIESVSPTGLAAAAGLRAGDVVVSFNGTALESQRRDPEDPDRRLVRLLRALPCGSPVVLEYVRDGRRHSVEFEWQAR